MRALVLQAFGQMSVEDRPTPKPERGEVLLRIIATGICGSDIHGFTGENGRRVPGQVMGHESVGTVAAVGQDVDPAAFPQGHTATFNPVLLAQADVETYRGREQHAPSKRVIGVAPDIVSSFAEYIVVPQRNVVLLPDDMPVTHGALIEPLAVALHAVRRVRARMDDKLLIIGGGPIGQSVVLAARAEGITQILVSEVDPSRRELCERIGAAAIDPLATSVHDAVANAFGDRADVAIDAVGLSGTLADALGATKPGGSICLVGMGARQVQLPAYQVSTEERTLIGSFTYSADDFRAAAAWVAEGHPELDYLVTREVSLNEGPAAFAALAALDGTPGKVLVRIAF